jgi:membrane associated rhomboid family serine protease
MIPFKDNIPSRRFPFMTMMIIIANIAALIYEMSLPWEGLDNLIGSYGVVPSKLQQVGHDPLGVLGKMAGSLVSSTLLHAGFVHLLGNMWYLWIFGNSIENRMGPVRFLLFYLSCGMTAGLTHIVFNLNSPIPTIGASGAVAGVLGAYLVSYPFARVLTLIPFFIIWPIVELPAILILGFWFVVQLFNGTAAVTSTSDIMGGIAWWAHIGGFISGILLLRVFASRHRHLKF